MVSIYYVYIHYRLDKSLPFYVGVGTKNCKGKYRCKKYQRAYIKSKFKRNYLWLHVFNKCKKQIKIDIVFESIDRDIVLKKEQELIKFYGKKIDNTGILTNITDGGEGSLGVIFSDERLGNISKRMKGINNSFFNKKHTEETRKYLSELNKELQKGVNNSFYGKTHNEKTKKLISTKIKKAHKEGKINPPPIQRGKDNYFSKKFKCINHNLNLTYIIEGGIKDFCDKHTLAYDYVKKFKNKGKIKIELHSRLREKSKNTIGWEFIEI